MRSLHVVPHVGNAASGPSYSVPALGRALGLQGCETTLLTQAYDPIEPSEGFENLSFPERSFPPGLHWSTELGRALKEHSAQRNVIHNHSIWLAPNIYSGLAARSSGTPLVLAPRGALSPAALEKSRWKKRMIWPLQRITFQHATCFHATAEKEYEEIRTFGQKAPVAIIPNGIDLPDPVECAPHPDRTLLFLGRIHPIKGLDLLLQVWRDLDPGTRKGWTLRIVGNDPDGHQGELEAMVQQQDIPNVNFAGPAFGADKTREYAAADLYVLPTKTENFGMTVAESLATGTPVITTRGAPWSGLEENGCGWWVERNKDALTASLVQAMSRPDAELAAMGAKGRDWVNRAFGWQGIARDMIEVYQWLIDGMPGELPSCVRID